MTQFNSDNISEFEQQVVGSNGEVMTLKELCAKANLRMDFTNRKALAPYILTLRDSDYLSHASIVFQRRNYEKATKDVLKYINDKLNDNWNLKN
ncbi:hypothetical protein [Lactobacillus taiwanensis]|uniref:hypothetical protein n=1 Tax=Lactobacillus taiwanensis TaxID=508451 RepID=UPI00260C20B9